MSAMPSMMAMSSGETPEKAIGDGLISVPGD